MNKSATQNQPTVKELLVSIRQAIHDDKNGHLGNTEQISGGIVDKGFNKSPSVTGSMSQMRVSLQPDDNHQGISPRQQEENFFKLRKQLQDLGATALHEDITSQSEQNSEPQPAYLRQAQESIDAPMPPAVQPTPVRSQAASGFAGILSGDANLENALKKLKRAGLTDSPDNLTREPGHVETSEMRTRTVDTVSPDYGPEYEDEDEFQHTSDFERFSQETGYQQETDYQSVNYQEPDHRGSFTPQPAQPVQTYLEPYPAEPVYEPVNEPIEPVQSESYPQTDTHLVSPETAVETSAAFNRLAETIIGQATTGERSVDDITRDLLRPMLRSWLDENLPRMVERLVREEIERVARWGGK